MSIGFCPGVRVHKGITIALSLFRSHWLAVVYCSVLCIGSFEPVHEDRTQTLLSRTGQATLHTFSSSTRTSTQTRVVTIFAEELGTISKNNVRTSLGIRQIWELSLLPSSSLAFKILFFSVYFPAVNIRIQVRILIGDETGFVVVYSPRKE